ncbi:hypothetical protein BH11GEM1_BH11GEM1_02280 [soil metagenome]
MDSRFCGQKVETGRANSAAGTACILAELPPRSHPPSGRREGDQRALVRQREVRRVRQAEHAVAAFDILNLDNLLNHNWGAGQRFVSNQPLIPQGADANGALLYRLRNIGTDLLPPATYQNTVGINDV